MGKIFLLAIAAAWAAVLLPPLLRNRIDNRPGSSVTDFRRQLSTLERAVPTRHMTPMRSMARPLAPSPLQRPAVQYRPAQQLPRSTGYERQHHTGELARRVPREHGASGRQGYAHARQISRREMIRRRRINVLFFLVMANATTLFLAATTAVHAMIYVWMLVAVSLCGYVYRLWQLRQYEQDSRSHETNWFNAA